MGLLNVDINVQQRHPPRGREASSGIMMERAAFWLGVSFILEEMVRRHKAEKGTQEENELLPHQKK